MYYVYIIESEKYPGRFYMGFSRNLKSRIRKHNLGDSVHTSKFRPWKPVYYSAFIDKELALEFERYLKTGSGFSFRNKRLVK